MRDLSELAWDLEDSLTDFKTWLPEAISDGRGREVIQDLKDLCDEILTVLPE